MLEESLRLKGHDGRPLGDDERDIILAMLGKARGSMLPPAALATIMNDGGMGGVKFLKDGLGPQKFGKILSTASYMDSDGVEVSLALSVDHEGDLFELDIWKVDFSPLIAFPRPNQISITNQRKQE